MRIRRRHVFRFFICLLIFLLIFANRFVILRGFGNFLIRVDEPRKTDAIFVLSGNSIDRGKKAAEVFKSGNAPVVVCLGGEKSDVLEAWGIQIKTCEVTRRALILAGVDSMRIDLLCKGTSTFEEFDAIIDYCRERKMKTITIVSSLFHTRRINSFFRGKLSEVGIEMVLIGAPESSFEEQEWWKKEEGLIFLNNEYIKMVYYFFKY